MILVTREHLKKAISLRNCHRCCETCLIAQAVIAANPDKRVSVCVWRYWVDGEQLATTRKMQHMIRLFDRNSPISDFWLWLVLWRGVNV